MKRCTKCGEEKPLEEFRRQSKAKDGRGSYCKICHRAIARKWHTDNADRRATWLSRRKQDPALYRAAGWRNQGIDVQQATTALRGHSGRCDLCGSDSPGTKKGWAVDHCHDSGRVRGILCFGCNTGLGGFKDNPDVLRKAAEYLQRSAA